MPLISLFTSINAPVERVFDLSRNLSLHAVSMQHTSEKAIAGKTTGLIQKGETVTWQATHLFKSRTLTVSITQMEPYTFFRDEMLQGDFKVMKHEHRFEKRGDATLMTDLFYFESPYGWLGKMADVLFLRYYMKRLLLQRNRMIKMYAETDLWQSL